jgi:membrane protein implicated in regulation of membrane protease activity
MRVLRTIIGIGIVLLTVGAVAALWGYFEWFAPIVAGKVVDKQERIAGSRVHSAPGRYLSTSFKLKDETEQDRYIYGSPHVTDINVDQQTYRRLPAGAAVTVKYLPINPAMARLEGQPLVPPTFWKFIAAILLVITSLFLTRTRMAVVLCTALAVALLVTVPGPPSSQFALTASVTTAVLAVLAATLKRGTPAHIHSGRTGRGDGGYRGVVDRAGSQKRRRVRDRGGAHRVVVSGVNDESAARRGAVAGVRQSPCRPPAGGRERASLFPRFCRSRHSCGAEGRFEGGR